MNALSIDVRRSGALALLACCALALRPPSWTALIVTMSVGALGVTISVDADGDQARFPAWLAVVVLGSAAFVFVRFRSALPPMPFGLGGFVAGAVAAIAEEAFFRRMLYGWLERWGVVAAVAGSAVAFAAVHVPSYGLPALPVDLAAGLVFGWQRWATGRWSAPAATHLLANIVQGW